MTPAEYSAALEQGGGLAWTVLAAGLLIAAVIAVGVVDFIRNLMENSWEP